MGYTRNTKSSTPKFREMLTVNALCLGATLLFLSSDVTAFSLYPHVARLHGVHRSLSCPEATCRVPATQTLQMNAGNNKDVDASRRQLTKDAATMAAGLLFNAVQPADAFAKDKGMYPLIGDESIMAPKAHGTSEKPVQQKLRWGCNTKLADGICSYNRDFAEFAGYWESTSFLKEAPRDQAITFYDSVTGKPLFVAPKDRSFEEFVAESKVHGWPSFRDQEVVWDSVRCLPGGETVSLAGTHLGHNLPDKKGNRYCINLVSVAGMPAQT